MKVPSGKHLQTETPTTPTKESLLGLTVIVLMLVVFGSFCGGWIAWPLWNAPHVAVDGAVGGVLLIGVGVLVLWFMWTAWRRGRKIAAIVLGGFLCTLGLISASIAAGASHKAMCGTRHLSMWSTARVVWQTINQRVTEGRSINGSIALAMTRDAFVGDWYSDNKPQCACRMLAAPMIGAINLLDVFAGTVTIEQAEAEFATSGLAAQDWETLGDYHFARDSEAWRLRAEPILAMVITPNCVPCGCVYAYFSNDGGTATNLWPCDPSDREKVINACNHAQSLGIALPPNQILDTFKITQSDLIPSPR